MRAHVSGSFEVYSLSTGEDVTPRSRKARALLAYLLSDPGTKKSKIRLSSLLWGDRGEVQARSSLRQVLLELRRALNRSHGIIFSDAEHVWLCAERVTESDSVSADGRKEVFEDLDHITPDFDEWLAGERTRRSSDRMSELKAEAESLLARGLGAESSPIIEHMRTLDALNEDALRLGMEADFQQSRPAAIAQRFRAVAAGLRDELGVEPSSNSRALRDQFLSQVTAAYVTPDCKARVLHEEAEEMLQMGAWQCDLQTEQLYWTPGTFALFGIPLGSAVHRHEVLDQYDPQSRRRLEHLRAEAIRGCSGFTMEADILSRDGSKKRLRIIAVVETKNGIPSRMFGTKQLVH